MKQLLATQSVLLILLALSYAGLTFYALVRWNAEVSITAQSAVSGFFRWLQQQDNDADGKPDKGGAS
jgi:hypothetical protein